MDTKKARLLKDKIHSKAQKGLLLEEKINYFNILLVSETQFERFNNEALAVAATFFVASFLQTQLMLEVGSEKFKIQDLNPDFPF